MCLNIEYENVNLPFSTVMMFSDYVIVVQREEHILRERSETMTMKSTYPTVIYPYLLVVVIVTMVTKEYRSWNDLESHRSTQVFL